MGCILERILSRLKEQQVYYREFAGDIEMIKRKTVFLLILMLIITSMGCRKISRKKDDITPIDVESIPGIEDVADVEEKNKEENQYSNIPLVYWDTMDQYKKILEADIDDVGQDFYQKNS